MCLPHRFLAETYSTLSRIIGFNCHVIIPIGWSCEFLGWELGVCWSRFETVRRNWYLKIRNKYKKRTESKHGAERRYKANTELGVAVLDTQIQ